MIFIFLTVVVLIFVLGEKMYALNWNRGLSTRVRFARSHIYAGDSVELTEVIENRKRMPVPVLEIGFRVQKGLRYLDAENTATSDYNYKTDVFSILGMESITRRYNLIGDARGRYSVTGLTCHAPTLLFNKQLIMDRERQEESPDILDEIYVYARRIECSAVLRAVEVMLGQRESSKKVYEDPFAFASIREYTIRDPMKTINWKASARTGQLMVNTYTSVLSDRVILFWDAWKGNQWRASDLLEGSISLSATLCQRFLEQNRTVGLATSVIRENAPVVFAPGSGRGTLAGIEYFLTGVFDAANTSPLEHTLEQEGFRDRSGLTGSDDSVCIFISANDSPSLRSRIRTFLGKGRDGILVVPCHKVSDVDTTSQEGLHVLPVTVS